MKRALLALALVLAGLIVPTTSTARAAPTRDCGALDRPETGLQGEVPLKDQLSGRALQGYNCGLALVGHTKLKGVAANAAYAGNCAYVATIGSGVNVIDVSNPAQPRRVKNLYGAGSSLALETIAATNANGGLLVAARYGYFGLPAPMDVYDVSSCAKPRLLTTFDWPENVHNLTFSPDGKRIYSTLPVMAVDVSNPSKPTFLGSIQKGIPQSGGFTFAGEPARYLAHEVEVSDDGNTLYLGGQTPMYPTFTIVDITNWPARKPRVVSQVKGRGHSIDIATMNGRTYAVHSEESVVSPTARSCFSQELNPFAGVAEPWISDITDPAKPVMRVSRMKLRVNAREYCARSVASSMNASVHYHDVDRRDRTTFLMASMWNAGLRIFDIRDPRRPKEAAYFNPGAFMRPSDSVVLDKAWGHVRYDEAKGQIWFATQSGGFWVVELEPQVRSALGLKPIDTVHPRGARPRPASTQRAYAAAAPALAPTQYVCTLGPAGARL